MHVVRRGQPLDVSQLDPNKPYLWVIDREGNFIIAPERQPAFGRVVKHGDLVPGGGGEYRGVARAGGELNARIGPNGEVIWTMDNNSSYTFLRSDKQTLGADNLRGAYDVLTQTGTDTSRIVIGQNYGGATSPAPGQRPGAVPVPPLPRRPEQE
jgi:hypothetical protein